MPTDEQASVNMPEANNGTTSMKDSLAEKPLNVNKRRSTVYFNGGANFYRAGFI